MAPVLGKAWSKLCMLDIYLNIAEWGDGPVPDRGRGGALFPQEHS